MSPSDRAHLVSDAVSSLSSAPVIHGDMNLCVSVHGCSGGVAHVNSYRVKHANSGGAFVHWSSCESHGADVLGRTKPLSVSTRCTDRRPAVGGLASLPQASGSLHDEAWAGRVGYGILPSIS